MTFAARKREAIRGIFLTAAISVALLTPHLISPNALAQQSQNSSASSPDNGQSSPATASTNLPRGKKLILKDGTFQLVREYQMDGDRVRYYSLDSSQWEAMPADMVDWDATKKEEAEEAQRDAAVVAKIHTQELGRTVEPLDIDASLEVAPGIFLPPGDLLFAFDGKAIFPVSQAETDSRLSKAHFIEQVFVPVPIIPTRHTVSIQGTHAKLRLTNRQPEFYMRVAGAQQPQIDLIRAKISGNNRQIENLDELFGAQHAVRNTVSMQRWDVAQGVYRFTLAQPLAPGEYALAEVVPDEDMSLYVWDFGVDKNADSAVPKAK